MPQDREVFEIATESIYEAYGELANDVPPLEDEMWQEANILARRSRYVRCFSEQNSRLREFFIRAVIHSDRSLETIEFLRGLLRRAPDLSQPIRHSIKRSIASIAAEYEEDVETEPVPSQISQPSAAERFRVVVAVGIAIILIVAGSAVAGLPVTKSTALAALTTAQGASVYLAWQALHSARCGLRAFLLLLAAALMSFEIAMFFGGVITAP